MFVGRFGFECYHEFDFLGLYWFKKMDLDDVLKDIGEYDKYQQNLLLFVFLPCMFPCAFHAYDQLFMIDSPPHCCRSE